MSKKLEAAIEHVVNTCHVTDELCTVLTAARSTLAKANDAIADKIIAELDYIAREYDHYDYGLPGHNDEQRDLMRAAINKILQGEEPKE